MVFRSSGNSVIPQPDKKRDSVGGGYETGLLFVTETWLPERSNTYKLLKYDMKSFKWNVVVVFKWDR